jgi:hypothetical protein
MNDDTSLQVTRTGSQSIVLGPSAKEIPLDGLPPEVAIELRREHAKGMIDVNTLAHKYGLETQVLATALRTLSQETVSATKEGIAITATRLQEDSLGKTEVIMGNTETAQKGKLTRAQSGLQDYTLAYIVGAVIVVIVLALLLRN